MIKSFIFNNSLHAEFINIPTSYLERLLAEFHVTEVSKVPACPIVFTFLEDLEVNLSLISRFRGPVAVDQNSVFLIDQADHIARVEFHDDESKNMHIRIYVQNGFDPHFFYILVLYAVSVSFVAYGGVFVHAACLQREGEVIVIPAWRHAGKTHLAFSLMNSGYELISDDGIWLSRDGDIHPVSKMIHILYHNVKLNKNLTSYLDEEDRQFFQFLENMEKQTGILTDQQLRYMKSKFRVRKSIGNNSQETLRLSKSSRIVLLKRQQILDDDHQLKDVPINIVQREIRASSNFELAYIFDLFHVWQCKFGQTCHLLEHYQSRFDENLHAALKLAGTSQQYSFSEAPQKEKLFV